jgi:hypothetical protein
LSVIPNLPSEDIVKTIVLAVIGANVSFLATLALKELVKRRKR